MSLLPCKPNFTGPIPHDPECVERGPRITAPENPSDDGKREVQLAVRGWNGERLLVDLGAKVLDTPREDRNGLAGRRSIAALPAVAMLSVVARLLRGRCYLSACAGEKAAAVICCSRRSRLGKSATGVGRAMSATQLGPESDGS